MPSKKKNKKKITFVSLFLGFTVCIHACLIVILPSCLFVSGVVTITVFSLKLLY